MTAAGLVARRWGWVLVIALALSGCAALGTAGGAAESEVDVPAQLQSRQVIVTLAPAPPQRWASIRSELARAYDLHQVGAFPLQSIGVECAVFQVPANRPLDEVLTALAADPRVETVQPNQPFSGLAGVHDDPYADMQYGARVIHADVSHRWATGRGVRVAVVDTGVDTTHPDLRDRILKGVSFVQGGEQTFSEDSHGTAVAGVIAAIADNHIGIFGVAPNAQILAEKACWHRRPEEIHAVCSSWTLAKAVDFAIGSDVQVLNLSLGGPPDALLHRLIDRAAERGITVVAAVVDQGGPAPGFPASLDSVIAVVASDQDGVLHAPAFARPVVLAAPGVEVLTTAPHGSYDFRTGSSLAAAHVSGVVALLLERNPHLAPTEVRALLLSTAAPIAAGAGGPSGIAGRVDACAALAKLVGAPACQ